MYRYMRNTLCFGILFFLCVGISRQQEEDIPHNEVRNWALKFGVDLWEFGRQATKLSEIQRNYHTMSATVNKKDGLVLVREMAMEVKNMLDFKMNAVMRLMENAEQAAVSSPRDSATSPRYYSSHEINRITDDGKLLPGSRELLMTMNRHFDNLPVNLSMSAVLLPPGVVDTDSEVSVGLQWSDHLDPLFVNNYESDPTLSWQYFGATAGFLRRFPAISWPPRGRASKSADGDLDIHDFRMVDWFIGGATSPKDLAIFVDTTSFSSRKLRKLAIATTKNILDTLSANDYVNVYRYAESTEEIIPCFKDNLVQALPENIRQLKNALYSIQADSTANISAALVTGFEILYKYNRTGMGGQCNQAIMLVTSNTDAASSDLIKKYNWPHMPVRIFTYLIGGDKSSELQDMACSNKGFYARVTSMEDVRNKVFEYIKILARPMVLYQHDHPIHWTPAYVGGESARYGEERRGQLMTSVTAPILDRRNHTVKTANLLGIVGTDVPIEEVQKLVPPYKLGVNGYSFIVNNNGRVLYHHDLRPLPASPNYENSLHPRYTNVDLAEVELAEFDGPGYPPNNSLLLDLRHDMIDQKEGETNFAVKIHYDDMKRVTIRRHNYFYVPIGGTPFSLGLALPEGYGMLEVHAEMELKHAIVNVFDYLNGTNWKVHPDWVYCEYNSASEKIFHTPEERILHFLVRTRMPGWKWMSMRPKSPSSHHNQASKPDKDAHYCDKTLVQSLVMDAVVTGGFNKRDSNMMHKEENQNQGKGRFDVVRSFIATRSGLFRWHDHQDNREAEDEPHFADMNKRAMDTSWYKRAAEQHAIEPESFVFSVPFNAAELTEPLVTATHAVFVEGKNQHKAPAAVVGLQLQHSSLASHFMNITSTCTSCKKNCASEELDCYILDNSGFIIISERHEHTGKFFGEIDGTIMDSLVQDRIYRKVTVVDYQGVCPPEESYLSSAPRTISKSIVTTVGSMLGFLWSSLLQLNIYDSIRPAFAWSNNAHAYAGEFNTKGGGGANSHDSYSSNLSENPTAGSDKIAPLPAVAPAPTAPPTTHATSAQYMLNKLRTCEKKTDLYILQPERLNTSGQSNPLKGKLTNCHVTGCERPFSVQKILHTNLILLVVDTLCPCGSKQLSIEPAEVVNEPDVCTTRRERLYRRRPPKCINYHPEEMEIKYCGVGHRFYLSYGLIVALFSIYYT
ncbi:hypothetical protein PV328_003419 [Microctonus aethiopoides]|uniref:VWFA domain-containing protein n=1 Tax=Microctonus aethiopoides TaxID=144406 RepID=A0AA39F8I2_9HYME|nr:hypothetical protein PV328_003419 [Microctonus aethiopoides]